MHPSLFQAQWHTLLVAIQDVALTSRISTQKVSLSWQFLTSKHGQHQWEEGQVGVKAHQ